MAPITAIPGIASGASSIGGIGGVAGAGSASTPKVDFGAGLEAVSKLVDNADALGGQVATGKLGDVHDFMAASAKAGLAVELTAAVRNRAVEAYQEIMRMQV